MSNAGREAQIVSHISRISIVDLLLHISFRIDSIE